MGAGFIGTIAIQVWPELLLAWLIALGLAGTLLGLAFALDDWMNGVPPIGKRELACERRMAIPSDVLLGAVAELRCGQARNGFAALGAVRS